MWNIESNNLAPKIQSVFSEDRSIIDQSITVITLENSMHEAFSKHRHLYDTDSWTLKNI